MGPEGSPAQAGGLPERWVAACAAASSGTLILPRDNGVNQLVLAEAPRALAEVEHGEPVLEREECAQRSDLPESELGLAGLGLWPGGWWLGLVCRKR